MKRILRVVTAARPEVRSDENGARVLSGLAAVFNSETVIGEWFREQVAPGAFAASLKRNDEVVALFNHNPDLLLGRRSNGTLRVWEDETGLRYEVQIDPEDPDGVRVLRKVERGDVIGSSFAFAIEDGGETIETAPGALPLRTLRAVRLYDVSPVTSPAYEATTVAARSAEDVAEVVARVEAARVADETRAAADGLDRERLRWARARAASLRG